MTEHKSPQERLRELQNLSKEKSNAFAMPDCKEALSILSTFNFIEEESYNAVIDALADFPPDLGVEFLLINWQALKAASRQVPSDLRDVIFNTPSGKRLRISLAANLLSTDPDSAVRLLLDALKTMKAQNKAVPLSKDLKIIHSAFLEAAGTKLDQLSQQGATKSELVMLTTYVLAAAFMVQDKKKALPPHLQLSVIRWSNVYPELSNLPEELKKAITQAVASWDDSFRVILARESGTSLENSSNVVAPLTQAGTAELVTSQRASTEAQEFKPVCHVETTPVASLSSQTVELPALLVATEVDRPSQSREEYDVLHELERVRQYLVDTQSETVLYKQQIEKAGRDLQEARDQRDSARGERNASRMEARAERDSAARLASEKSALQRELDLLRAEKDLSAARFTSEKGALQTENESLRVEIDRLSQKLATVESRHKEMLATHSDQLDTLSNRIAHEGNQFLEEFRNKLGAKLRPFSNELAEAADVQMSPDLVMALRNQMRQLFRLLKDEGINIGEAM